MNWVMMEKYHSNKMSYLLRFIRVRLSISTDTIRPHKSSYFVLPLNETDDDLTMIFSLPFKVGKFIWILNTLKINIHSYRSVLHVERAYELQEHSASFALFQGLKTLYLNVISFRYCLFCQGRRMFLRGYWIERYLWAPRWGFINVTLGLIFSR